MSKTITLRVPDETYKELAALAKAEHRPLSNFIMHHFMNSIAELFTVDEKEMQDILSDKELLQRLERGQKEVKEGKYKIVG